mmetsp:Transcript_151480/g.385070  ORF Transcript_151480/g.385070 Transcript_151480/m.385070 type:complete len:96 (+) Transcript_151480:189-476(+)
MSDNHGAQQLRQKELDSSAWGDHLCTYQELEKCKTEQTFRADSNLQLHHTASEFLKNPPSQKPMNLPYPVSSTAFSAGLTSRLRAGALPLHHSSR